MASLAEILRSLFGAYRLARFDPAGLGFFDNTVGGFWRSFTAAFMIAPFLLLLLLTRYASASDDVFLFRYLSLEVISYAISWVAFPLIMDGVSRSLDREKKFLPFMVAYNWSMIPQNMAYIIVVLLGFAGIFSEGTTNALIMIVLIWSFAYTGFIAQIALDVRPMTAGGIVVLDFLLSLCIEISINSQI